MKRHRIDIVPVSCVSALTAMGVWLSASGCERITMVFWVIVLGAGILTFGSIFFGWRYRNQQSFFVALSSALFCVVLLASVAIWQWPLHISYAWSRGAFGAVAQQVRAGESLHMPQHIGLFTIRSAEVSRNGIVCLWIGSNSTGRTGFVQCRQDHVHSNFNLWSLVKLDDQWQFVSED